MMGELFWQLMRFAVWLAPEDPAAAFMWLAIGATALVLAAVLKAASIVDRMRCEVKVASDYPDDDETAIGEQPHLPRGMTPPPRRIDIRVLR